MIRALIIVALLATSAAADSPAIDVAIHDAAAAHKKLIVELGADWCGPCKYFERTVLTDATVIRELASVMFVRYDIDTPNGTEAAERYNVEGVPAFVVIDENGVATFRVQGFPSNPKPWFLELIRTGRSSISPVQQLRDTIAAHPDDIVARMTLARVLASFGQTTDALAQYTAVLEADTVDPIVAAEAEAAIDDIQAGDRRVTAVLDEASRFASAHPSSPITSQRLALLAVARTPDLDALIASHLAAVRPIDRPNAVRVALVADRVDLSRAGLENLDEASASLLRAEIAFATKNADEAKRIIDFVCKSPAGVEAWCLDLMNAVRSGATVAPGVVRLRDHARSVLDNLRHPGSKIVVQERYEPTVRNAIARLLLDVEERCGDYVDRTPRVAIGFDLAPSGGKPTHVAVLASPKGNMKLEWCVNREIARGTLPALRLDDDPHVTTYVMFPTAQTRARRTLPNNVGAGIGVMGMTRTRDLVTHGLALDSFFDMRRLGPFRLTGAVQIEGGVTDTSAGAYAARAIMGIALVIGRDVIDVGVGIGGSQYGKQVERASEIPVELRLRGPMLWGRLLGTFSVRGTYVLNSSSRDSDKFLEADEVMVSGTYSLRFGDTSIFFRLALETRAVGTSTAYMLGIAAGTF